jgi:hypothetical protein
MAFWWAIPAAVELGSALLSKGNKTPNPLDTEYGQYLNKVKKQGKYSPAVQSTVMGRVGAEAGNVAQDEVARTRGELEARGMGNSISGIRALATPGLRTQEVVANAADRLTVANEESKAAADERLAGVMGQYRTQRAAEDTADWNRKVGGIAGALKAGVSGWQDEQLFGEAQDFDKGVNQLQMMIQAGKYDTPEFQDLWRRYFGGGGNPLLPLKKGTSYPAYEPSLSPTRGV